MHLMVVKQKKRLPRTEVFLSVATLLPPVISALVLHWVAIGRIPSIPLKLALWAAFVQVALVGLLGLRAGCLIQYWRLSSAVSVIGTIALGMLALYLTRVYLSVHDMQVFACLLPLTWTVIWGGFYLCISPKRDSFLKLLAVLSASWIGICLVFTIWYMGGGTLAMKRPAIERFPYTFTIWDTRSVREHFFMLFDTRWFQFEKKLTYHGYPPMFTVPHYLLLKFIRWYSGVPYENSVRFTAFAYGIVFSYLLPLFTSYHLRLDRGHRMMFLGWLYVPVILVLSIPDIWTGVLEMDADNCFPLFAICVYCITCSLARVIERPSRSAWWICMTILVLFSALMPLLFAFLAPALLMMYIGSGKRALLVAAILVAVSSVGTYLLTWWLAKIAGFTLMGSGFMFRSGLSVGAVGFPGNIVKALVSPVMQDQFRPYSFVWVGISGAVVAMVANFMVARRSPSSGLVFLLVAPVVLDLVVFSQSHSIHPYLYDIPTSVLGALSLYWVAMSDEGDGASLSPIIKPWVALVFISAAFGNFLTLRAFFLR